MILEFLRHVLSKFQRVVTQTKTEIFEDLLSAKRAVFMSLDKLKDTILK